eukprot:CAMPEP_0184484364 /NCGR_PEP_ID=MMETSP0113_2-20130426/6088_1 /TAXON_ID=91329 /ORGANISM="Norrisiella sphaerica, Strain BC52" /LENGTH=420 /DNA_ID=CAMNT_0026865333 /DNA_START=223 /DNA_END=1485 /DNA_ORIENTATION=+
METRSSSRKRKLKENTNTPKLIELTSGSDGKSSQARTVGQTPLNAALRFISEKTYDDAIKRLSKENTVQSIRQFVQGFQGPNAQFVYYRPQRGKSRWIAIKKLTKMQAVEYIANLKWKPAQYLLQALMHDKAFVKFCSGKCTSRVRFKNGFWEARHCNEKAKWWPDLSGGGKIADQFKKAFHSVIHFVQPEAGTGVHIGQGFILTCAHVVCADEDGNEEEIKKGDTPNGLASMKKAAIDAGKARIGREKIVMFPSGQVFKGECVFAMESADGTYDCALLRLQSLKADTPFSRVHGTKETLSSNEERCFCIGNPSSIDLESPNYRSIEFVPKVWHLSVGSLQGPSTRKDVRGTVHSCWTYWGHSGAPLFSAEGKVIGLHSSWDTDTGARISVGFNWILSFLSEAVRQLPVKVAKDLQSIIS